MRKERGVLLGWADYRKLYESKLFFEKQKKKEKHSWRVKNVNSVKQAVESRPFWKKSE